jgi:hypothetical protein
MIDQGMAANCGRKTGLRWNKGIVAVPPRLRIITASALPPSNQIEATLFD